MITLSTLKHVEKVLLGQDTPSEINVISRFGDIYTAYTEKRSGTRFVGTFQLVGGQVVTIYSPVAISLALMSESEYLVEPDGSTKVKVRAIFFEDRMIGGNICSLLNCLGVVILGLGGRPEDEKLVLWADVNQVSFEGKVS